MLLKEQDSGNLVRKVLVEVSISIPVLQVKKQVSMNLIGQM